MRISARTALVSALLLTLSVSTASATTLPVLSTGTRGEDVALLQRLLTANGKQVSPTGYFGTITEHLVREFQAQRGIGSDGIVGATTWHTLEPTVRRGSVGGVVRALQTALNDKHGYRLAVDGVFGPRTQAAVIEFQKHMGLVPDGVAGPVTWEALTGHFVELPWSGPGWYRYHDAGWGTGNTIATLKGVLADWSQRHPGMRIGVGDISLPHGGPIDGHVSHQKGVDADFRLVRGDGVEGPITYYDGAYSRSLTQELVNMLRATGEVELIFFNDPQVEGVEPWPYHDDHLHIRFYR